MTLAIIGAGGFAGAIARYGLSGAVHRFTGSWFPYGTMVVNVLGCLAIGVLMTLVEDRQALSQAQREFLVIGLLGSFTTFSTFGWESIALVRAGSLASAAANVALSVALGLVAVASGRWLALAAIR